VGDNVGDDRRDEARRNAELRRRIGSADEVKVRLDAGDGTPSTAVERTWEGLAGALVTGDARVDLAAPYAVLGGPGTGKTSLLLDTLLTYLRDGGDPASVMVVTPSKEAATELRGRLTELLRSDPGYAATGTPVRSVHSWAFALLRVVAQRRGDPLPRLMTGADHDLRIRELLRGQAEDGTGRWPDRIRPALPLVGFARQLRDLLLRAAERGVGADRLEELGRRHGLDMWVGAGAFLREYEQIQRLSGSHSLNASDLLHRTLEELNAGDEGRAVVDEQRRRVRLLLVDDAHNLDPASGELVRTFATAGVRTLIAGDPDQCVFHFRGADEEFLTSVAADPSRRIVLSRTHRLGTAAVTAVNRLERRLPAAPTRVPLRAATTVGTAAPETVPDLVVHRAPSETAQRLVVADAVRRARVLDQVPWDRIAVVVRSTGEIPGLRRTLLSHGIPVKVDPTNVVLAEQPLVAALLQALDALVRPLTLGEMQRLVESPIGGADPVMLRRMERAAAPAVAGTGMRALEAVGLVVTGRTDAREAARWTSRFGPREREVLDRIRKVTDAGRDALDAGASVETILWEVWQATGLSTRLQTQALRGGTLGSQADRDLDAVMSLFDIAGDLVERTPAISLTTFLDGVRSQELPTGGRDRRGVRPDAVEILPAHAAAGREWGTVVVSGAQEDSWPAGPTVGGLFGQQELVDLIDRGIDPAVPVSRAAAALAEERRLFLLAVSRATRRTVVTAVASTGDEAAVPSRFLDEICGDTGRTGTDTGRADTGRSGTDVADAGPADTGEPEPLPHPTESAVEALPRVLAVEPLVAELRDAVCDPRRPGHERRAAAANLARLASAGVYGADPETWWGTAGPSTREPAVVHRSGDAEPTLRISPTLLENLGSGSDSACDLTSFLDRLRSVPTTEPMKVGTMIHAVAEGFAVGLTLEEARETVTAVVPWLVDGPAWTAAPLTASCLDAVERLHGWLADRAGNGRTVEVEKKLEHVIGETPVGDDGATMPVVLAGRTDRLETAADGATTVIDFKTGKNAKTKEEAAVSPQLSAYQLLMSLETGRQADGAMLVYPRVETATVKTLQQGRLSDADLEEFRQVALAAAARVAGPAFTATDGCEGTEYACLCPACRAGEQVV
jgi:superfamily I DNA/RNA helicase/RecB family exonuclease